MLHKVLPPDFRYVGLTPGPGSAALAVGWGTAGIAATGVALWSGGHAPLSLGLLLGSGALLFLLPGRHDRRIPLLRGAREVAMAIVPWGVLVTPETELRVLRWPAVRKVSVEVAHTLQGGTPSILSSLVTVHTEREILAGRAPGPVDLERLIANLDAYAEESVRPVAADLDGAEPISTGEPLPVGAALLRQAQELCSTSRGAARLCLPPGGYRTAAAQAAAPETISLLRSALGAGSEVACDPRPLAALLAGLLRAVDLVPDLLRLVSSPHPVVAAAAKASALRLGAPQSRAGSIDEVAAFLFEEDAEFFERWSEANCNSTVNSSTARAASGIE